MGSANRAMWQAFGVGHNKTSVQHPARPDKRLYFMPDVPHLVKNLKSAPVRGQTFIIPPDIVLKEGLQHNEFSLGSMKDMVEFHEEMPLKITSNLTKNSSAKSF